MIIKGLLWINLVVLLVGFSVAQQRSSAIPSRITQNLNPFRHSVNLDQRGKYVLEWEVDWKEERIYFNVTVSTNGWVGFGLSKKGTMKGADIVIGGVDKNGKPYFSDRHALDNKLPILDESQDWTLHETWERGVWTFLSFSRPFDTCDSEGDLPIGDNLLSVIWAYSERDDDLQYHFQNKGNYDLYLLDPDLAPGSLIDTLEPVPQRRRGGSTSVFQMREQMILPAQETMYYCSFHRVPTIVKHHIIGFHGTTYPSNREQRLAHRLLLYRCRSDPESIQMLEQASRDGGGECYPPVSGPTALQRCRELVHAWGFGGRAHFFPDHVGVPMSESGTEYFMLQVHYDNPNLLSNATVTLTLDAYYTRELRANDASLLILGSSVPGATNLVIPPSSLNHVITGHCAPGCTEKMFPEEGVSIVSGFLLTHPTGRRVSLNHYRNGKELPYILKDDNFNPYYLQLRLLRDERKILRGDQLIYKCVYDTAQRNGSVVTGNYGIRGELCLAFVYYYARVPGLITCLGGITAPTYQNLFGIRNTTFDLDLRDTVVTDPAQFSGLTISDYLTNYINWDIKLREEVQRHHLLQPQTSSCPTPAPGTIFPIPRPTLPAPVPTFSGGVVRPRTNFDFNRRTGPFNPNDDDDHDHFDGFGPTRARGGRKEKRGATYDYVNGRVVQNLDNYGSDLHYDFNVLGTNGRRITDKNQNIQNQRPNPRGIGNAQFPAGIYRGANFRNFNNLTTTRASPIPSVIPPVIVMTVSNREESFPPNGLGDSGYKTPSKCRPGLGYDHGNNGNNQRQEGYKEGTGNYQNNGRNNDNEQWNGQDVDLGQINNNNVGYSHADEDYHK
ncbi:unnamed protein product [Orchesella dallaii]|uniref:DOMON domain-containing protein n=1 Tax=Orchesella dallaii TaxID=48710 RepID=A0ABP1PKN7_9HEXA